MRRTALIIAAIIPLVAEMQVRPVSWSELPARLQSILRPAGVGENSWDAWLEAYANRRDRRVRDGMAEHVAYYILQSNDFTQDAKIAPLREARSYRDQRVLGEAVQRRIASFLESEPKTSRHRLLRSAVNDLPAAQGMMRTAFQFLLQLQEARHPADADVVYQQRGLSADPFPQSTRVLETALTILRERGRNTSERVWLIGPGLELGSRFGVDDAAPVDSPQARAVSTILRPREYVCSDIRDEVIGALGSGPCRAIRMDIVTERPGAPAFDLAIATNILLYLDDTELALAMANIAAGLRPGGCLIHNDGRFAARALGEAVGLPVVDFRAVSLGERGGREQMDRAVVQCRIAD